MRRICKFTPMLNIALVAVMTAGCSFNPFLIEDPQKIAGILPAGPATADVVKSMRCEIVTFLVANRLRADIAKDDISHVTGAGGATVVRPGSKEFGQLIADLQLHRSLPIDPNQYAYLSADFKNTNVFNVTPSWDLKAPADKAGNSRALHYGPAYSDTRTYQLTVPIAIDQGADLGPEAANPAAQPNRFYKISKAFGERSGYSPDESFYCFKSLSAEKLPNQEQFNEEQLRKVAEVAVQGLVRQTGSFQKYANFQRIYVGLGGKTLALWFQEQVEEQSKSSPLLDKQNESAIIGQIFYSMILDIKPSFDFKYTLIAYNLNPFVPDVNATPEHAATFTIGLNTVNSAGALAAKTGSACIDRNPDGASGKPSSFGCPDPFKPAKPPKKPDPTHVIIDSPLPLPVKREPPSQ